MNCAFDNSEFVRIALRQTDSTNNALRESLEDKTMGELPEYFTIVASYQFSGRGQRGNSWESEAGKNLLFSTLLHPSFLKAKEQFRLSQVVSLALTDLLCKYAPDEPFSIKWPNDIYWGDKKICGILIEHDLQEDFLAHSIVGVGLNINQETFLSDAPNPCSLIHILEEETNLNECLVRLMSCLRRRYAALCKGYDSGAVTELEEAYHARLYRADGALHPFRDTNATFQARILQVQPAGALVLQHEDGTQKEYLFKEVQYII